MRPNASSEHTPSRRILVVDDYADAAALLDVVLEGRGHVVHLVQSAAAALAVAKTFLPHVLLIDVGGPETDRWHLCESLRACPALAACHFIAITRESPDARGRTASAGFDAYLCKPVSAADVLAAISRI